MLKIKLVSLLFCHTVESIMRIFMEIQQYVSFRILEVKLFCNVCTYSVTLRA